MKLMRFTFAGPDHAALDTTIRNFAAKLDTVDGTDVSIELLPASTTDGQRVQKRRVDVTFQGDATAKKKFFTVLHTAVLADSVTVSGREIVK